MFINRPLIHGPAKNRQKTTRNSQSIKESKNKIRIKTVSSSVRTSSKIINPSQSYNDLGEAEGRMIGIKDVKQMLDYDIDELLRGLGQLQEDTEDDQRRVNKRFSKMQQRQTTISQSGSVVHSGKDIGLQEEQQRAYTECRQMLQLHNSQEQKLHERVKQSTSIRLLQLEETKIQMDEVLRKTSQQSSLTKKQVQKLQQQLRLLSKKQSNKQKILRDIEEQRQGITQMNQKLFQLRQQSMRQKQQFIQVQADQIRVTQQLQQQNTQQTVYNEGLEQFEYYKKIQKLRDKLLKIKEMDSEQLDQFMNQRITNIVNARVSNDQLQEGVIEVESKIEEQLAVIEMLERRNVELEQEEEQREESATSVYREKYNKIFLNSHANIPSHNTNQNQNQYRELNHWFNYKQYLHKILKLQQKLTQNTNQLNQNTDYQHDYQSTPYIATTKTPSEVFQVEETIYQQRGNPTKLKSGTKEDISMHPQLNKKYGSSMIRPQLLKNSPKPKNSSSIVKQNRNQRFSLPKLIKMQGRLQDRDKIKNELAKFTNQRFDEDIQLQTVRSSEADGEDVIEVEFRGKRQTAKQKESNVLKRSQNYRQRN